MSVEQIPNLTPATALNGTEQLEAVQAGSSVRLTVTQIGTYINSQYPAPGISSVTATSPLTSTTVSGAVTIALPSQSVTNAYLATMAAGTVKANLTASSAVPTDVTPSAILDTFGTTTGSLVYRGASSWQALTAGTNTQVLTSNGATSAPSWQTLSVPSGNIAPTGVSAGTYGSASLVPQFTVLASGQLSVATNVAILIPSAQVSGLGTMATQNASAVVITGGTADGTAIGATTPSTGAFTTISASSTANFATIASGAWNGTAIGVTYGGTGATTAAGARTNLGAAASGANSDITSLSGLTTPLSAPQGGTGFSSYTTGDLLYADTSSTLARLNDVATGNALISGGVGVAPSWGKIALTTHVSGTLPVANGGTGATTLTGYLYGNGTGAFTASATIPNAGLTYSSITIGSTAISLGGTSATLAGLTTVTLTQDPTLALQASTKQYVDGQVAAVSNTTFHTASSYATTAALSATYSNGTAGVGATLTNSIALAALTIDGYTFTATDVTNSTRVLVKDQSSGLQNGIYTVTNQGSALVAWVLTRATDFDTVGTGPNYIETGASTFVTGGAVYGSTGWVMNTTGTITVGSTALVWVQSSSSASVTVTSPLVKVGSVISLGTVPTTLGGTGLTTLTAYNVMLGNGTGNVAFAAPSTTGYPLLSTGAASNPAFGQLSLTAGVTGTLPVANGGTGTATAFTAGSVVFAGASGIYTQDNAHLFFDDTNNRLGINTATPQTQLTIVSNTQTVTPTGTLPAGTDIYIVGADAANTRITQDAYGTGNYPAYTGRQARGTAAAPTASQTDDILVEVTGRGYGASAFSTSSVVRIDLEAAENFTNTAQGTYISFHTSALGAATAVEKFRMGPSGQWGIGGATYGTSGYSFVSGGASAAPSWSQVSLTAGVTGTLPVANGGTNIASYAVGDLIYASGATTLSKLAAVATGNVLRSGGLVTAPAWGQVALTTDVTGTLPIANGGTGLATTPANGALDIGNGTGFTRTTLTAGTAISVTNGAGSISIANTGVTSNIAGTGISVSGATGAVTVTNTGVTSAVAGTNISVSGATGAVTISTSATPSFATSVTSPLIIGGTAASSSLTLQSTSGVGTTDSILFKVGNNGATTAMTIDTSGNFGVGGAVDANGKITSYQSATQVAFSSYGAGTVGYPAFGFAGQVLANGGRGTGMYLPADGTLGFATSALERMRIDSSGNVGIGTSSPSTRLQTSTTSDGAQAIFVGAQSTNEQTLLLRNQYYTNNSTAGVAAIGWLDSGTSGGILTFKTGTNGGGATNIPTERFRVGPSGQWGIGGATYGTSGYAFVSGGASAAPSWSQISLTAGVTGTLPVANGGTGVTTSTGSGNNVLSASPTFTGTLAAATITASGTITGSSTISDSIGNVREVPPNAQSGAYVLVASDSGKYINITTGGVTVNASIFSSGQSVTIYNNSASSQTITQGTSVTMYLVGTATTGNRTLAQRGVCTILCVASNTFVITGGGLT
jgi:hypothetical protein